MAGPQLMAGPSQMQVVTELKTEQDPTCPEPDVEAVSSPPVGSQTPMDADKQAIYRWVRSAMWHLSGLSRTEWARGGWRPPQLPVGGQQRRRLPGSSTGGPVTSVSVPGMEAEGLVQ